MIKYKYAINQSGSLVDINFLPRETVGKDTFTCLSCGRELNPRLGKQRVHHFYHKVLPEELSCNGQTYLHLTSIEVLYNSLKDRINNTKSLLVQTPIDVYCKNCHFPQYHSKDNCHLEHLVFDLISRYDVVKKEQPDGKFQPDILLYNSTGDKIYIEVTVTHGVEEEKILSGIKIIELFINEESQINILSSDNAFINEFIEIKFHNFNIPEYKEIKPDECKQQVFAFVIYKSGKSILKNLFIKDLHRLQESIINFKTFDDEISKLLFNSDNSSENKTEISKKYIFEIEEAIKSNFPIKSCHLCAYHVYTENSIGLNHKFTCSKNNNSFKESNDASTCQFFTVANDSFYSVQNAKFKEKQKREREKILYAYEQKRSKEEERRIAYFGEIKNKNKIKLDEENAIIQKTLSETVVKFIVYYDTSAIFISEHKSDNKYSTDNKDIIYSIKTDIPFPYFRESIAGSWRHSVEYVNEVNKAFGNGIPISNCYLCQNHKITPDNKNNRLQLTCPINLQNIKEPNNAKFCEKYIPILRNNV